jgi:hypothetical protein
MKRIAEALRARVGDFRQSGGKSYSEPLC